MEETQNDLAMYATPKRTSGEPEIYPVCDDEFKPSPGMIFDSLEEGIDFCKNYSHHVGFSVRLSSTKKSKWNNMLEILLLFKRRLA